MTLIQSLTFPQLQEQAQQLAASIETATGPYQDFLVGWGYDDEQKQAIQKALRQALNPVPT
jgi:hypothetical protein